MNDRSECSSGHLGAKLGEVAPNRSGLLRANLVCASVASRKCHSTVVMTSVVMLSAVLLIVVAALMLDMNVH
jgi:hypothetical protein